MNGLVDDQLRALIRLPVASKKRGKRSEILAWIDTAFNGGLVIPKPQISTLGLIQQSSAEAVLADGSLVELETYACHFDWFGESYETQVIANDGAFPLIGTLLLDSRKLVIDYEQMTVELS